MTKRLVLDAADEAVRPYALLTALVVPRPIAWVSTVAADGAPNLAPHSFFTVVSAHPPVVSFTSVGEKDTLRNVRATGEFVVNIATVELMEQVNATSAILAPEVDEAAYAGVAMVPSAFVRPQRVAASPAALECRLHQAVPVGDSVVVLGEVVGFSLDRAVLDGRHPDFGALRPVARLGRDEWSLPGEVVRLPRPR